MHILFLRYKSFDLFILENNKIAADLNKLQLQKLRPNYFLCLVDLETIYNKFNDKITVFSPKLRIRD